MPDVRLVVQGAAYGGWKTINIVRGIEQIAGTFELGVSERWPDMNAGARQIAVGDRCELSIDGAVVITGHVDDVDTRHSATQHDITVSGRDATGDLVDCAAIFQSGKWSGRKMEAIAADLAAPFGIAIVAETDTGAAVPSWQIQESESVFDCLERLARDRGVLLVSDGKGRLVITRASSKRVGTDLVRGQNILAAKGKLSIRDRFSEYIVKAQDKGADTQWGATVAHTKVSVKDPSVQRYRPLVVVAEDLAGGAGAKRRAEFERNIRAGRSIDISVTVQGWTHADGLWQPNTLVHVRDEWLRLDHDLLIKQVTFNLDAQGTTAELAVTMREAFDRVPLPAKTKGDMVWEMQAKIARQQLDLNALRKQQQSQVKK